MNIQAIRIHEHGGPEVLRYERVHLPDPGRGEARVRHTAIGLNFIDTYHRTGLYPAELPAALGTEAAGVVEAVGPGVTEVQIGDRVVWTGLPPGSYAESSNYPAWQLAPIPDGITEEQAAASFLKGLTAWYLLRRSYQVQPGDPILVHAAAGGVGSLTTQWAKHLGAMVIGVVGTEEKAKLARRQGCHQVIMADDPDLPGSVRALTKGNGVAVVYDSIGKATFFKSLDSLRPHGMMVTFGNASGPVEPFSPAELAKRHSLYLTRPVLFDFISTRTDLLEASQELFGVIDSGVVEVHVNQRYPLKDAAQAHSDLENRKTTGSTILDP
jgi:NADPH2:quinone reductase